MKRLVAKYLYTLLTEEPMNKAFVDFDENTGEILDYGLFEGDLNNCVYIDGAIVPAFVNTHCHIELSSMKGLFKKGTGMTGFINQINRLRNTKSREQKIEDIKYWLNELWLQGVSALGDISNCDDSFEAKLHSPIYTRSFLEVFGTETSDCESIMASVRDLSKKAKSLGLDAAPCPHSCYTMSQKLIQESAKEGLKDGFLSYHSEETPEEEEMIKYGRGAMYENRKAAGMSVPKARGTNSLIYFVDTLKEVLPGPLKEHILLVHECCMDQEGIDYAKQYFENMFIALCPLSNIFIHNLLPPIDLMLKNNLRLTIGTDSLSSNDELNMVKEFYCLQENFKHISLGQILTWACKNGADFLKKSDNLGTIEKGKKPGLVVITHLTENKKLTIASKSYRII